MATIRVAQKWPELSHVDVEAEIIGSVAIHRSLSWPSAYTVTHVASGMAVQQGLTSRRQALRLAKKVAPLLPDEGTFGVDASVTEEQRKKVVDAVYEWRGF